MEAIALLPVLTRLVTKNTSNNKHNYKHSIYTVR